MENQERTFGRQDGLPSLPVPNLRKTLDKYLDSVRVHVHPDEYDRTKRIVDEFEHGIGAELHKELVEHASKERNWLKQWWEEYAYHIPRYPILPLVNFGGSSPNYEMWPPRLGTAMQRGALMAYWLLRYWELVRKEQVPISYNRGTPWCMDQLHRLFNTCRIPGKDKDHLKFSFKTVSEGDCPSHIVVMHHGLFWRVNVVDPETGTIYTPPQLQACFEQIEHQSKSQQTMIPVGALTCLDRTDWYQERQHLLALSIDNDRHLKSVEEAIFVLSFTDQDPVTDDQLAFHAVCPNPYFTWADKSAVWHIHASGMITMNCDHSNLDAIIVLLLNHYADQMLLENGYQWKGVMSRRPYPTPVQLKFITDSRTVAAVGRAMETCNGYADDVAVTILRHTGFGMNWFKKWRLYGDTIVQLALQLAYFRLHHRPAPTYETAATRKYYHGRTETIRSCTAEAVAWAKSMLSPSDGVSIRRHKLDIAMRKHNRLMAEAMDGEGCDRHLLGLRILAEKKGLPVPEIYTDPAWKKSGGDGNFILSSSFLGYNYQFGGVAAMCTDGYGIFYAMGNDSITFYLSAWKSSKETDVRLWRDSLEFALTEVKKLLEQTTFTAKY